MAAVAPKRALARSLKPEERYRGSRVSVTVGRERFRVWVVRGSARARIDQLVTSISVTDDPGSLLTGSIEVQVPETEPKVDVQIGDQVLIEVSQGSAWVELFRLRVGQPSVSLRSPVRAYQLEDELVGLGLGRDDF